MTSTFGAGSCEIDSQLLKKYPAFIGSEFVAVLMIVYLISAAVTEVLREVFTFLM